MGALTRIKSAVTTQVTFEHFRGTDWQNSLDVHFIDFERPNEKVLIERKLRFPTPSRGKDSLVGITCMVPEQKLFTDLEFIWSTFNAPTVENSSSHNASAADENASSILILREKCATRPDDLGTHRLVESPNGTMQMLESHDGLSLHLDQLVLLCPTVDLGEMGRVRTLALTRG